MRAVGDATRVGVEAALALLGLDAATLSAAVVVADPDDEPALLAELLARCPSVRVLLIAPGLPVNDPRCTRAQLPAPGAPAYALAAAAEIVRFLGGCAAAPRDTLPLLPPAAGAAAAPLAAARAVVHDFFHRASAALLADRDRHGPAVLPLLRAIADFLFGAGEHHHALAYHLALHAAAPEPALTWRILESFAELGCPAWVDRWVRTPVFSDEFRAKITAEVAPDLAESRRLRQACLDGNRAALAHIGAAAAIPPTSDDVAFAVLHLPDVPWRLRFDGARASVVRDTYPLIVAVDGASVRALNPPPDLAEVARLVAALAGGHQPHALVTDAVAHAWTAEMLLLAKVASPLPGWQRLVFLVERNADALAALLATHDLGAHLASNARLFVGPDATAQVVAHLAATPDVPLPGLHVGTPPELQAEVAALHEARIAAAHANKRRLDTLLTRDSLAETLAVLDGRAQRPLRILIPTSRYSDVVQHAADDLADGFRALGHQCVVLREAHAGELLHQASVSARLLDLRPDFIVLLNHTRAEALPFHPTALPFVAWIQDEQPALRDPALIATLGPLDFTYAFGEIVAGIFRSLGYPFVGCLPFAVPADIVAAPADDAADAVVFMTHVVPPPEPTFAPGLLPRLEAELSVLPHILLSVPSLMPFVELALAALGVRAADLNDAQRDEAGFFGLMVARALDRVRLADVLLRAGLPFTLYGRGWERLPRFAPHHRGTVTPGAAARAVMRAHKVVLHRGHNLHPRLLEGLALGSFVTSQRDMRDFYPGETADHFVISDELFLFRDDDELVALVRKALGDERWRRRAVAAAQARIKRDHTYQRRAEVILADLRAGLLRYLTRS